MNFKEFLLNDNDRLDEGLSSLFTRAKRKIITKLYKKNPEVKKLEDSLTKLKNNLKKLEDNLSAENRKWVKGLSIDSESLYSSIADDVMNDLKSEFDIKPKK